MELLFDGVGMREYSVYTPAMETQMENQTKNKMELTLNPKP